MPFDLLAKDGSRKTSYSGSSASATVETRVLIVGVRLVRGDKELWKATQELTSSPGLLVVVPAGGSVAGRSILDGKLLGKVKLPKFLLEPRGKDADRTTLGSTWVRPDRLR